MSNHGRVFVAPMRHVWQLVTLQAICWRARVILILLVIGAILDWMR